MNPYRSSPTHEEPALLNIMSRGGTKDWIRLYHQVQTDSILAQRCANALALCDPDLAHNARIWKSIIEKLHPEIEVSLNHEKAYAI